jgi:hypothetical protein
MRKKKQADFPIDSLDEIQNVVKYFNNGTLNQRGECKPCFVYYFNTTGILEHNDIGSL